jgi:uncharacterized protein (DUF1778 family)
MYKIVDMNSIYPIRLSSEDRKLFRQAARAAGLSLAEFMRSAAREKAQPARKEAACLRYTDNVVLSLEAETNSKEFLRKRLKNARHR